MPFLLTFFGGAKAYSRSTLCTPLSRTTDPWSLIHPDEKAHPTLPGTTALLIRSALRLRSVMWCGPTTKSAVSSAEPKLFPCGPRCYAAFKTVRRAVPNFRTAHSSRQRIHNIRSAALAWREERGGFHLLTPYQVNQVFTSSSRRRDVSKAAVLHKRMRFPLKYLSTFLPGYGFLSDRWLGSRVLLYS